MRNSHWDFGASLFARRDKIIINKVLISQRANVAAQVCQTRRLA